MAKGQKTGGRQKGTLNKTTAQVKDMVRSALDQAGGQDYLARQAEENPGAFLSLVAKLVPTNVRTERVIRSVEDLSTEELAALAACGGDVEIPD